MKYGHALMHAGEPPVFFLLRQSFMARPLNTARLFAFRQPFFMFPFIAVLFSSFPPNREYFVNLNLFLTQISGRLPT